MKHADFQLDLELNYTLFYYKRKYRIILLYYSIPLYYRVYMRICNCVHMLSNSMRDVHNSASGVCSALQTQQLVLE